MAFTTPRTWVDGEVPSAATFNTHVRDNIDYFYEGDAWHTVTGGVGFQNGWLPYDDVGWTVRYRKVGDLVVLQGLVKNGTIAARAFQLPAGYRPGKYLIFASTDQNSVATSYQELRVNGTGDVVPQVGSNGYFSVYCMFLAEL